MAASTILIGTISPRWKSHYTTLGKMPTFLARRLKGGGCCPGLEQSARCVGTPHSCGSKPAAFKSCRINPEPCSPFRGAHAPSRVPAGAFAGRSGNPLSHQMVAFYECPHVFREGAEHRTR